MALIDRQYLARPYNSSRRMAAIIDAGGSCTAVPKRRDIQLWQK